MKYLVQNGGMELVNKKDKKGKTVLHFACNRDNPNLQVVTYLVQTGGEELINKQDIDGYTALHTLMSRKPSFETINQLFNAGAMEFIKDKYGDLFKKCTDYRHRLLNDEYAIALKEGGRCPIRRGRVTFLGRGRAGKTSTLRAMRGEPFDGACKSTVGINVSDANVREIGMEITVNAVSEEAGASVWKKVDKDDQEKKRSVTTSVLKGIALTEEEIKRPPMISNQGNDADATNEEPRKDISPISILPPVVPSASSSTLKTDAIKPGTAASKSTEEEVATSDEYNVDDGDGNSLRITVWDYGGQDVFRSIQHLYMPRHGCYVLVFDLTHLLDETEKRAALDNLHFWIKSIEMHAVSKNDGSDSAPIVFVGTHYDDFKESPESAAKLTQIDKILVHEFGAYKSLQKSETELIKGREFLYNKDQKLCFWPVDNTVDNTISDDGNIQELRTILVRAIVEDPLKYLDELIPISWLDVIDELARLSKDGVPLLRLYSDDKDTASSVLGLLREKKAFDDIGTNHEDGDEIASQKQKKRAIAFLQFCHRIGVLVYFDAIPGLQDFCILDPQWLLDTITYVVRDFQLHRFRRDHNAMELNDGKDWESLLRNGILEAQLLRKLWLGEDDQSFGFLCKLMIKIGLFGYFTNTNENEQDQNSIRFLVPSIISSPFPLEGFSISFQSKVKEHLGEGSILIDSIIEFPDFLPTGFYDQVVARLVTDWSEGYGQKNPQLFPLGSLLYMCSDPFALVLKVKTCSIDVITTADTRSQILPHIKNTMNSINREIYRGRLQFNCPESAEAKDTYRNTKALIAIGSLFAIGTLDLYDKDNKARVQDSKGNDTLRKSFIRFDMEEGRASEISSLLLAINPDLEPDRLKWDFDVCQNTENFINEVLVDEFGIRKEIYQSGIVDVLEKCPKPLNSQKYLIGYFDEVNVNHASEEKNSIEKALAHGNLTGTFVDGLNDIFPEAVGTDEFKVLHLSMHGDESLNLANRIALNRDDVKGAARGSIECVFINACSCSAIATVLSDSSYGVRWVISWETDVNDEAAKNFAESFYHYLGNDTALTKDFEKAYNFALTELKKRGWITICPKDGPLLLSHQQTQQNTKLKAAGIPHLFASKTLNVGNLLSVEINSHARMKLKNGYSEVEIALHSLKQGSTDVASFTNFVISDVKDGVPLLTTFDETPVKIDPGIAKGTKVSLSKKLENGIMFKIDAMAVTHEGKAGTDAETKKVDRGDFKFNVELEFPEMKNALVETGAFVDLGIEIKTKNRIVAIANNLYVLGEGTLLHVPSQYYAFDEKSNNMQLQTMVEGYPKLIAEDDGKQIFTLRFSKSCRIFYDPTWRDTNHETTFGEFSP